MEEQEWQHHLYDSLLYLYAIVDKSGVPLLTDNQNERNGCVSVSKRDATAHLCMPDNGTEFPAERFHDSCDLCFRHWILGSVPETKRDQYRMVRSLLQVRNICVDKREHCLCLSIFDTQGREAKWREWNEAFRHGITPWKCDCLERRRQHLIEKCGYSVRES